MDRRPWEPRRLASLLLLAAVAAAAPKVYAASLEAASLQLGALQSQAQYAPSALQGARTASRSAASCLVTAVQYTHGQQIWRADPCEFCLCLDGEMFCWWQECPPAAPGPCPSGQPYSLCGNSSSSSSASSPNSSHKIKKVPSYRKTTTTATVTPIVSTKSTLVVANRTSTVASVPFPSGSTNGGSEAGTSSSTMMKAADATKASKKATKKYRKEIKGGFSPEEKVEMGVEEDEAMTTKTTKIAKEGNDTRIEGASSQRGCLVMGVVYRVGESLPSTGSCLACECAASEGGGEAPPRVSCAPRGCAPLDPGALPDDQQPETF